MKKQCWVPPEPLEKAQVLAFNSLLLCYSNRLKYQSYAFYMSE